MNRVLVVDGGRTPFLRVGAPGLMTASDLAVAAARPLLERMPFTPNALDQVVVGCVGPKATETNIARLISLRLGCTAAVPAWTVQRNCASGLQAIDCAAQSIASGQDHLILAGGTEAMSHAPLLFPEEMVHWMVKMQQAKKFPDKLKVLARFRPKFLSPVISLLKGLTDSYVNLNMGQTAEELAYRFGITRLEMDQFSAESHKRSLAAFEQNKMKELSPLFRYDGQVIEKDEGVRLDSTVERLAKLKAVFDRYGNITAGNSSQISDGAAFVVLASEAAVAKYKLPVLGEIKAVAWAGLDPKYMGLGPVHSINKVLESQGLAVSDLDFLEINEAFAAQVIACQRAWADPEYCQEFLGSKDRMAVLNFDKINVDGGAISIGHPVGASGARLVIHLLHILNREKAKRGVASLCIGGGQGGAVLLERV